MGKKKRKERVKFTAPVNYENDNLCHFLTKNDNLPFLSKQKIITLYCIEIKMFLGKMF